MNNSLKENSAYAAWTIAVAGMIGSLYFSEIRNFPPCILCWYQRIALYPLVAIIAVGIVRKDKNLPYYVLPLSIIGGAIAFYHNLLYYNIISGSIIPCTLGISCTTKFVEYFGFVTIPLLSFSSFVAITILMLVYKNYLKSK